MSRKRASLVNLFFNYANVVFLIVNGLVLVPIYLNHFSVSTYGSFLASGNIISMIGLLDGGMSYVLTQKLSDAFNKGKFVEFNKLLTSGLLITIFISIVIVILSLLILPYISDIVNAERSQYFNIQICFIISAISACLGVFFNNLSSIFQATLQVKYSGIANTVSIIIGLIATLFGLNYNLGVVSIPLGFFVKYFVSCILLIFFLKYTLLNEWSFKFCVDKMIFMNLINTAIPMFVGALAKSMVSNSQLLIVNIFTGPASAAIYFITYRIFQICDSFLSPIGSAIYSSITQLKSFGNNQEVKNIIVKIFEVFNCLSIILLSSSYLLNQSFINLLLGQGKFGGNMLSLFMAISMFLYTRVNFISVNLFAIGTFGETALYDFLGSIFKLLIIFSFIKFIGVLIIPLAELFSTITLSGYFLSRLIIRKLHFERFEAIDFITSGYKCLFIVIIFNLIWLKFSNLSLTIEAFVLNAIILGIINLLIVFFVSKEFRSISLSLISNLNRN